MKLFNKESLSLYIFSMIFKFFPLKNYIVFESNSDFSDNSKALYDYMVKNNILDKYKIYWAVKDDRKYDKNKNYRLILKSVNKKRPLLTIKSLYVETRAKYCFFSHDMIGNHYTKGQVRCFLMHGTSLKNLGKVYGNKLMSSTHAIVTSEFTKSIHNQTKKDISKISLVLGYPRNDKLFINTQQKNEIKKNLKIQDFKKVIVWMPTFKHHNGGERNDYGVDTNNDMEIITNKLMKTLNTVLKENNTLLIIKLHPAQNLNYININEKENIKVFTNLDLFEKNVEVYSLMAISDALITDFSSVYTDYLLLDKPIGFELSGIENYQKGVGFIVDNPLEYMPGEIIQKEEDLLCFIKNIVEGNDMYKEERKKIKEIYHKFCDNNSSKRIIDYFKIGKDEKSEEI